MPDMEDKERKPVQQHDAGVHEGDAAAPAPPESGLSGSSPAPGAPLTADDVMRLARSEATVRRDLAALRRLAATLAATAVDDSLAALQQRLDSRTLTVLVLGEFKRGKSALINSLLGSVWLPVGPAPATRVVTEVRYGPEERIELLYADGVRQPMDRAAYDALITEMTRPSSAAPDEPAAGPALHHETDLQRIEI